MLSMLRVIRRFRWFSSRPLAPRPLLAALGLVTALPAAALDPKSKWVRAKTAAVEVLSDASQKNASEFAVQYSAFRFVLAEMIGEPARALPPSTVVLFRDRRDFSRYFPSSGDSRLVSVSTVVDGDAVLAQALDWDREGALRLAFEFETTWALPRMGYRLPIWAAQGTGKVFSTISVKSGRCIFGDYHAGWVNAWEREPIPWPRFFEINPGSQAYSATADSSFYHSQAWALMHWVWLSDERGGDRFARLVAALRDDDTGLRAIEAVTETPVAGLTKKLSVYGRRMTRTREFKFDEAGLRARMETGPADPAIVGLHVADLLTSLDRQWEAEQELVAARTLAPEHPGVREAEARLALRRNDGENALARYREAIALKTRHARSYLISAEDWLNQGTSGGADEAGGGGLAADTAIAELRRALELDPKDARAHRLLARAFYVRPQISEQDIDELAPGVALGDPTGVIRYYRALIWARLKKTESYRAALKELIQVRGIDAAVRNDAAGRLAQLAFNELVERVEQRVADGKFQEARELVTQARQTSLQTPALGNRLIQVEQWIEQAAQRSAPR